MPPIDPTEMFRHAGRCLDDCERRADDGLDWLRSDWPQGVELTDAQAATRAAWRAAFVAIQAAAVEARRDR